MDLATLTLAELGAMTLANLGTLLLEPADSVTEPDDIFTLGIRDDGMALGLD